MPHVLNKEKFELIVLVQVVNEFIDFATYTKKDKNKRFPVLWTTMRTMREGRPWSFKILFKCCQGHIDQL